MLRSKTDQRWVLMIGHSKEETQASKGPTAQDLALH